MVILQRSNSRKKISKLKIVINSMMKIIDDNDGDYHHYHHNDRLYWLVEIYTHMHTSSQFLPTKEKNIKNFSSDLWKKKSLISSVFPYVFSCYNISNSKYFELLLLLLQSKKILKCQSKKMSLETKYREEMEK